MMSQAVIIFIVGEQSCSLNQLSVINKEKKNTSRSLNLLAENISDRTEFTGPGSLMFILEFIAKMNIKLPDPVLRM